MPSDPRLFALRAALTRLRVHLDQAVTDTDAAISAWDGLDDTRINDEVEDDASAIGLHIRMLVRSEARNA